MVLYCGFCGLEYYQLCFCYREEYQFMLEQLRDFDQAADFRRQYYRQILHSLPSDAWGLTREPGYSLWRSIYAETIP